MKISVVIPLFNKKDSILRAIHSVLNQTVLPAEIIIVNDGSTDGSEQLVEHSQFPLVRLLHQENAGVSAARNKGIEMAKEEWIAFLDADDEWKPNYLQEIVKLKQDFPSCNVLATSYDLQDYLGNRKPIILHKIPFQADSGILTNYFEVASCSHPPIWSSAVVVKKVALLAIGGFPVGIKSGEDLLTWARLAVSNEIGYSKKKMSIYFQQISNIRSSYHRESNKDNVGELLENLKLYCNKDKLTHFNLYLSRWFKSMGIIQIEIGNNKKARTFFYKALNKSNERIKILLYVIVSYLPVKISMYINNNLK